MSIKEKYALTDEGVRNVKLGAVWTTVANLVVFASVGFVYVIMSAIVARLTGEPAVLGPFGELGFDPLSVPLVGWIVAIAVYLAVLFVCERLAYYYQYGVIYKESGRQRIALAERLRKLPLGFFGRRDLADLTETLMGDVKTTEHAYSHVLPELYAPTPPWPSLRVPRRVRLEARRGVHVVGPGSAAHALRRALQAPAAHAQDAHGGAQTSEYIQEALECVREVRATNQEERYLQHIYKSVDTAERTAIRGELATGLCVNGAQIVLRLGFATTLLAGATLIADGTCDFLTLFCFLLVVSRIYAPFDQALMLIAELFSARTAAARMKSFFEEPLADGGTEYSPSGHDVVFEHVGFAYEQDGEKVLEDVSFTAREARSRRSWARRAPASQPARGLRPDSGT